MHQGITYDKMFEILKTKDIIFFEDDFNVTDSKNALFYGLVRMNCLNRERLYKDIEKIDVKITEEIRDFIRKFDIVFDDIENWNEQVPYNDLEAAIELLNSVSQHQIVVKELKEMYEKVNVKQWKDREKIVRVLSSYGAGVEVPALFDYIFEEYIQKDNRWKTFRVFRDFRAGTVEEFKSYIVDINVEEEKTIVCILDNQLQEEKSAKEIIENIKSISPSIRLNIIGIIFSSFEKQDFVDENIYFEFVPKNAKERKIQTALAKSAYSYMLYKLKKIYKQILEESFDEAITNRNIAFYLSNMAAYEGTTNYQVITNWVKLLFDYKLDEANELFDVAKMTRLIGCLEDEETDFSEEMLDLNTFETFDFNINRFHEPIASGDVFVGKKGKIYILVGQDCDMMNSNTRCRKNGVSELVTAQTIKQEKLDNSVNIDSGYMYISNFRKNKTDNAKALKIRYSSREFMDNQILELCQFNDKGECSLDLNSVHYMAKGFEPDYYPSMYNELREYFKAILQLKDLEPSALERIVKDSQSKRLCDLLAYDKEAIGNNIIKYPLTRICRLKHAYMLYLYKMYLEYQGRHPFDCMNMTRIQEIEVNVKEDEDLTLNLCIVLSPERDINRTALEKNKWFINRKEFEEVASKVLSREIMLKLAGETFYIAADEQNCILEDTNDKKILIEKGNSYISIREACVD